jgi:hypothetical protein
MGGGNGQSSRRAAATDRAHDKQWQRVAHDLGDQSQATTGIRPSPSHPAACKMRMHDGLGQPDTYLPSNRRIIHPDSFAIAAWLAAATRWPLAASTTPASRTLGPSTSCATAYINAAIQFHRTAASCKVTRVRNQRANQASDYVSPFPELVFEE